MELIDLPSCQVGQVVDLVVQFDDQDGYPIDMSEAEDMKIRIELPDGTSDEIVAGLYADGQDGGLFYRSSEDDLPQHGLVKVQGFATLGGEPIKTDVGLLYVKPDANAPGDVVLNPPQYIGSPSSDGSWRFRIVDEELVIERREGGVWVQKGAYLP